jgi:hypothetical protein
VHACIQRLQVGDQVKLSHDFHRHGTAAGLAPAALLLFLMLVHLLVIASRRPQPSSYNRRFNNLAAGGPLHPEDIGSVTEIDNSDPVMPIQVEFEGVQYWYVSSTQISGMLSLLFPMYRTLTFCTCTIGKPWKSCRPMTDTAFLSFGPWL